MFPDPRLFSVFCRILSIARERDLFELPHPDPVKSGPDPQP